MLANASNVISRLIMIIRYSTYPQTSLHKYFQYGGVYSVHTYVYECVMYIWVGPQCFYSIYVRVIRTYATQFYTFWQHYIMFL